MALTVDISGFAGAMDAAATYIAAGRLTNAAVRGELGKVLQRAADYTHAPGEEDLRQRSEVGLRKKFNTYAAGSIGSEARKVTPRISRVPKNGDLYWVDAGGQGSNTLYIMNRGPRKNWGNRYARFLAEEQDRVADLELELRQYLPKIIASRGLSKQSWWQIGQDLGIEVPGIPAYVKAAVATDRRDHQNGRGYCDATPERLLYTLDNLAPMLTNPRRPDTGNDGYGILQRAFDSRDKAIMIAIEKGVFDDLANALRRFPGLALLAN